MAEQPPAFDDHAFSNRVARNESHFREINEAIGSGRDPEDDQHRTGFVCECGLSDCARVIEMTPAEYEEVRTSPLRFVVVEGHQIPQAERTVAANDRYAVVEKLDPGAQIAERTDPRSGA